ncbi:Homocysteine-binding domain [Phytophthora cactorum]|nr:Homocysteine-binding domain [Phytophthora cactorum]
MTTTIRKTVTLLDGGTGEELFARGLPDDRRIWSATALVHEQHHKLLREVHTSFLHANADYITCNNYGVTPGVGFSDDEIDNPHDETEAKVCGSLPPLLESYRADKVPGHKEGVRLYAMIARTLKPFVDCYLAETLSSIQEAKMALLGVNKLGVERVMALGADELFCGHVWGGVQAILFNCSQPEAICKALGELHNDDNIHASLRSRGVRLGAYANRLTVIPDDWALAESSEPQAMRTDLAVERYRDFVSQWVELGAEIVGGCCGIGPEYIASIHGMLQQQGRR